MCSSDLFNDLRPNKRITEFGTTKYETNNVTDFSDKFSVSPKIVYNTNNVYNVLMLQQPSIHNEYNNEFYKRFYKVGGNPKKKALPYKVD